MKSQPVAKRFDSQSITVLTTSICLLDFVLSTHFWTTNLPPSSTYQLITYSTCRESWMDINSQCSQQNSVQETFQNGTRGLLHSTVQEEAPTPVFLTTIFQSWLSFVTHIQAFQFQKVETYYCLKTLENDICLLFSVQIKLSIIQIC